MLTLKLPDGSTREVPPGARPRDIAETIGKRLAQAAIAAKIDGTIVDLDREIAPPADAGGSLSFQVLTEKDPDGNGIEIYADRPREQWPKGKNGELGMYTRPLNFDSLMRELEAV